MTMMSPQAKNEGKEGLEMGVNGADKNRGLRLLTGVLLILTPIAFNVFFTLKSVGFEPAADIVVVGYILWSIWLALFGIFLLLPRSIKQGALRVNSADKATTQTGSVAGSDRGR